MGETNAAANLKQAAAAYEDAVETAELRDIRLISADFTASPEIALPEQSSWKYGYSCDVESVGYDGEAGVISAWIGATAFCRSGRKKILNVKGQYLIVWSVSHPVEQETAERFALMLGPFATYPYFRSHFSHIASQAGLSVPPLPIMKGARRQIRKLVAPVQSSPE